MYFPVSLTTNIPLKVFVYVSVRVFTGIRLHVRGKAHAEWKITRAGERRTVRQDEHYIDERQLLWGKGSNLSPQCLITIDKGPPLRPMHSIFRTEGHSACDILNNKCEIGYQSDKYRI